MSDEPQARVKISRMHRIVDGVADALIAHTLDGRVTDLNPAACELLGWTAQELTGREVWDFDRTASPEAMRAGWAALRGQGTLVDGLYRRKDGRMIPVELRSGWLELEPELEPELDREIVILTVARDISMRRSLEERLLRKTEELEALVETQRLTQETLLRREKLAALGGLVAGVAHEINTPLGVNLTACSLVEERLGGLRAEVLGGTATRRRFLEQIDAVLEAARLATANGRRAADLVASFKKVAVDQTSEAEGEVELPGYLQQVIDSLRPVIKQARVRVVVSGDPHRIRTRPGHIAQIITNLVTNAIMHAFEDHPDPHIGIRCSRVAGTDARGGVMLTVEDNGWGMSEEVRRRAFEPFFSTRMGRGGSGLGLHIVYSILVDVLGGEVELDSAPGQGTSFRIHLPERILIQPHAAAGAA